MAHSGVLVYFWATARPSNLKPRGARGILPPFPLSTGLPDRPVLHLPTPEGWKAELTLVLVIYQDSLPARRQSQCTTAFVTDNATLVFLAYVFRFCIAGILCTFVAVANRNKKSPANAKGNAQQRCMFEGPVQQNQSPEGARRLADKYL